MYQCIDIDRIKQQNYLACVLCASSRRAVISILFHFFLSVVSIPKQSWLASSSICSPVSMSAAPSTLFMDGQDHSCLFIFVLMVNSSNMFPTVCSLSYNQQSIITCRIGVLEGDKALEVLYLLCQILSCPLTNEMATMISCCLKFLPLATTLNGLPMSCGSSSGWMTSLCCTTSCWPS